MSADTLVGGDLDVDAFVRDLADEPTVPCSTEVCENDARWGARCGWCDHDVHVCDACRERVDHLQREHGWEVRCATPRGGRACGWRYPRPMPWRPM